jgi:ArsR family transcriptional regulator
MPAWDEDDQPGQGPRVLVEPSAPAELFWFAFACVKGHNYRQVPDAEDPALAEQIRTFWNDGYKAFNELLILAHRGGCLLQPGIDRFLSDAEDLIALPSGELRLRTEQPDEAAAIRARLDRLRRDRRLRKRYVGLLRTAWQRVEPTWRTYGLPAVMAEVDALRERIERGASPSELLPEGHIVRHRRHAELGALIDDMAAQSTVALSPIFFSSVGSHILELPGMLHVGLPIQDADPRQQLAHLAEHVARKVKVLSDASRVAILADLARRPASITELAERFDLSQPTVSMHVKLLREADLLRPTKQGTRTTYSVDRGRVEALFEDVEAALLPRD